MLALQGLLVLAWPVAAIAAGLADPTNPNGLGRSDSVAASVQNEIMASVPRLNAVVSNGTQRVAIIDGRRVHEREQVGEYTVVKIGLRNVTLRKKGEILALELPQMVYSKAAIQ
jgi:hypothetical protein